MRACAQLLNSFCFSNFGWIACRRHRDIASAGAQFLHCYLWQHPSSHAIPKVCGNGARRSRRGGKTHAWTNSIVMSMFNFTGFGCNFATSSRLSIHIPGLLLWLDLIIYFKTRLIITLLIKEYRHYYITEKVPVLVKPQRCCSGWLRGQRRTMVIYLMLAIFQELLLSYLERIINYFQLNLFYSSWYCKF